MKDLADFKRSSVDIYWLHLPLSIKENLGEMAALYIGKKYGVSVALIAIIYCLSKGVAPVCGCCKPYHIEQLAQNSKIRLDDDEITALEADADQCGVTIMGADMFRFMAK